MGFGDIFNIPDIFGTPPFFPSSGGTGSSGGSSSSGSSSSSSILNDIIKILGVGAPIVGGLIGKAGTDNQANAALQASNNANAILAGIYNQQRSDATPFRNAGYSALNRLSFLMGLPPNSGVATDTAAALPGYGNPTSAGGGSIGFNFGGGVDNSTLQQQIATRFAPQSLPGTYAGAGSPGVSGAYPANASPSNYASDPGVLSLYGQDAANAEQQFAQANNFGMSAGAPLIFNPGRGGAQPAGGDGDRLIGGGVGDQGVIQPTDTKLPPQLGGSSGMPQFAAGGTGRVPGGLPGAPSGITDGGNGNPGTADTSGGGGFDPNGFGSLVHDFGLGDFVTDPGYQFRVSEGLKALQRSAAAKGNLLTGATAKSLLNYNQGAASDEYNQAFNRYNVNRDSRFNKLSTLAGFGSTANSQLINAGTNFGNNAASNTVGGITGSAAARASGYNDVANGITNSIQNLINMRNGGF